MSPFESLSTCDVCTYLQKEIPTISDNVLEKLKEHKVDGEVFLQLAANDESYMKEIASLLGDRLKLKKVIKTRLKVSLF